MRCFMGLHIKSLNSNTCKCCVLGEADEVVMVCVHVSKLDVNEQRHVLFRLLLVLVNS